MVEGRYTIPGGIVALPNRLQNIPASSDGQLVIPLGYVNDAQGDKYMVASSNGFLASSDPVISSVFVRPPKDYAIDPATPNLALLTLSGLKTDIPYADQQGNPFVMMLELRPQQKLDFVPEGVRLIAKDGTSTLVDKSYTNESDEADTIILYFPQGTHGRTPHGATNLPGDIIQLKRHVELTKPAQFKEVREIAKHKVETDIARQMFADNSMKRPDIKTINGMITDAADAELEMRFEIARQNVDRMKELLSDVDMAKQFSIPEKREVNLQIIKFEKNEKENEERKKKAQLKDKNAQMDTSETFESILEAGGFRNPANKASSLAANATGLPADLKGKLAKRESGMALGVDDSTA